MSNVVTPQQVEARLVALSKEIDESHVELAAAERKYQYAKAEFEVESAKARLAIADSGSRGTVKEREDHALIRVADLRFALAAAEAVVKSSRENANRLRTQVEIARSIGTSVRSALAL